MLLEKINQINLTKFNEKFSFNHTIHTTKEELQQFIQTGDLHYVWLPACPRANRITSVFKWYKLDHSITEHHLSPYYKLGDNWVFDAEDDIFEETSIQDYFPKEIKATQPFLYDQTEKKIISNNTYHMSMLMAELMDEIKDVEADKSLFPIEYREMLRKWNAWLYENVNLKIYQVASKTDEDKKSGMKELKTAYDLLNNYLSETDYLYGNQLTESDFRLFHNLIRHQIYFKQFKVFDRSLEEWTSLEQYVQKILEKHPKIFDDLYFDEIRKTHFRSEHNIKKYGFVEDIPSLEEVFPFSEK